MTRQVGAWALEEELGRGGAGAVYRARDPQGRQVALKLLAPADPDELLRAERELEALRRLDHPGIVRVLDAGREGARVWLAMELLPGSLQARLAHEGPLDPREAARIGAHLARALAHAHARGVLHRDLKPANVLLRADGSPVLADFGLVRLLDRESLTASGTVMGTPGFLAPEQVGGRREELGPWTDVHGLGATLFALLTGRAPFVGSSVLDTLTRVVNASPPPLPGVDPDLATIVTGCLAKLPAKRWPDAGELAQALEAWLRGRGRVRRVGRGPVLALLGATVGAALLAAITLIARSPPAGAPPPPAWSMPTDDRAWRELIQERIARGDLRPAARLAGSLGVRPQLLAERVAIVVALRSRCSAAEAARVDLNALLDLDALLRLDTDLDMHMRRAHLLRSGGDVAGARADLEAVRRRDPLHEPAHRERLFLLTVYDRAAAERTIEELTGSPDTPPVLLLSCVGACLQLGRFDIALKLLRHFPESFSPYVLHYNAMLLAAKGELIAARSCLRRACERYPDMAEFREMLAELEAIEPPSQLAGLEHLYRARAAWERGDRARADELLAPLLRACPNWPPALALVTRIAQEQGDVAATRQRAEELLRLAPERTEARLLLAWALASEGRTTEATASLETVEDRTDQEARYLGDALLALDRLPEAAQAYSRALERSPFNSLALAGKSELHLRQGELAEAVAAICSARTDAWSRVDRQAERLSEALDRRTSARGSRPEERLQLRELATRLAVGDQTRWEELSREWAAGGDPEGALAALERALELTRRSGGDARGLESRRMELLLACDPILLLLEPGADGEMSAAARRALNGGRIGGTERRR